MDKIQNLLQQVSIIQKKYEDLAEYSGEHYNVFDVLGVTSDELSHSAILTNLLNAKGKHGQKELFLELFLKGVRNKFADSDKKTVLDNFNIKNSFAVKEKYAGRVDYEADQGGRIDIIINDGKNNIIIENKIYAGDQPKQLVRYNEHDKNAPILYLTLDGKEPSPDSKGNLVLNQDFVCISYTDFIKDWLENCIKEMANKPIIRETLNQYLVLIKSLTNQSNNNKTSKEIMNIITKDISNFEAFIEIFKIHNHLKSDVLKEALPNFFGQLTSQYNLELEWDQKSFCSSSLPQYSDFSFTNNFLKENNLSFNFQFQGKDHNSLIYGLCFLDIKIIPQNPNSLDKIKTGFKSAFGLCKNSEHWLCYKDYDNFYNWNDFEVLKRICFGDFKIDLDEKLKKLLEVMSEIK